jgi:hypothetical protein
LRGSRRWSRRFPFHSWKCGEIQLFRRFCAGRLRLRRLYLSNRRPLGFGRERQIWEAKAFLSLPLTFVLIIATGYIGSFIVLVPGAQTFESLKDLVVLMCIVLFGYPALLVVPPAYMLSDLIEGVPPDFV